MASTVQDAVDAALSSAASGVKSLSVDGQSLTNRDIRELIELDNHVSKKAGNRFGFAMRTIIPPEH